MRRVCVALAALAVIGTPAAAAPLSPLGLTVSVPTGTTNPGPVGSGQTPSSSVVYTDDVYLESITFGSKTFSPASGNLTAALALEVLSGRSQVNVEWGDTDDGADGDATPMARIGQPDTAHESTDPGIQDAAMLQVFNSFSLTEMTDGEGGAPSSFKVAFDRSIVDDDAGVDAQPEIVLFERGRNDTFSLSLIIGGTFASPVLSSALTIQSSQFADVGLRVNTKEIANAQTLGVAGFDLNDWGLPEGTEVSGFVYSGSGADLSGIFASGNTAPLPAVPLPPSLALAACALAGLGALRRRGRPRTA